MSSNELRKLWKQLWYWHQQARKWKKEVKKSRSMLGLFTRDSVCSCYKGEIDANAVCKICGKCYFCHIDLNEIYDHADLYHQLEKSGTTGGVINR